MEASRVDALRQRLTQQRAELSQLSSGSRERLLDLEGIRCGRLARVEALQAKEMAQEAARRRREELMRIEAALARIEAGEYGACLVCGEDIDPRRLSADPTHTRCIHCAQQEADSKRL